MISIYRKCEKTNDNIYGISEITSISEVDKPFLFCISSKDDDNSSYGIIKEGARAARVRTTDELSGGFKIDEIPFMFLGFKNEENGKFNNLVNDFFYPLLTKDKDVSKMKKAARRMNFFAYCNAGQVYLQIEKRIHEKLVSDGYIEKEIEEILSQISLISIATDKKLDDAYATSVLFKDVNDADVYDKYSKMCEKTMIQNNRNSTLGRIRNGIIYGFFGTGEHDLKHYFDDENIVKGSLCSTVSKLVENSILNDNSEELLPISRELLTPIILKNNAEFLSNSVILDRLDNSLNYGNVSRYTEEEHQELLEYENSLKGNVNRL